MTKKIWKFLLVAVAGTWFLASSAAADTASMTLTGVGSNGAQDGIYIGPYVATINGVSTPVICDDFADDSYINESWTANVTTPSNLAGTKWGGLSNASTLYDEAAWLTLQLLGTSNKSTAAAIQYAIWDLFDPTDVKSWLSTDPTFYSTVLSWVATAGSAQPLSAAQLADFLIYTPNTSYPITCNGGTCANTPPQEFIVYTPEPSTLLLLGVGLGALCFLKRRERGLSASA